MTQALIQKLADALVHEDAFQESMEPYKHYSIAERGMIYRAIERYEAAKAKPVVDVEKVAVAIKRVFDLSMVEPQSGFTPEELAKAAIAAITQQEGK